MLVVSESFVSLVQGMLKVDAEDWMAEQVSAASRGEPASYRVLEAARGNVDGPFWAKFGTFLFGSSPESGEPDPWLPLHSSLRTRPRLSMAFACLAVGGGYIFDKITDRLRGPDVAMFLVLDSEEKAAEMAGVPPCCLEFWSYNFMEKFKPKHGQDKKDTLLDSDCQMALASLALLVFLTSSRIECRHAWIRRTLRVHETTSDTTSLLAVSCLFVLARARIIQRCVHRNLADTDGKAMLTRKRSRQSISSDATDEAQPPKAKARRPGGGGPWRSFLNQRCIEEECGLLTLIATDTTLSDHYGVIKHEAGPACHALLETGDTGSEAKRHGGAAFATGSVLRSLDGHTGSALSRFSRVHSQTQSKEAKLEAIAESTMEDFDHWQQQVWRARAKDLSELIAADRFQRRKQCQQDRQTRESDQLAIKQWSEAAASTDQRDPQLSLESLDKSDFFPEPFPTCCTLNEFSLCSLGGPFAT